MSGWADNRNQFKTAFENLKGRLTLLQQIPDESIIDKKEQRRILLQEFNDLWAKLYPNEQEIILKEHKELLTHLTHLTHLSYLKPKTRSKEEQRKLMSLASKRIKDLMNDMNKILF